MQRDFLNIGEVKVYHQPTVLSCYGLGSCVCVYLYDYVNKLGGGAHIALPYPHHQNEDANPLLYAENAIRELIQQMKLKAKTPFSSLRAKIIGGANVVNSDQYKIGITNYDVTRKLLLENGVFIAAEDVGGNVYRSGKFVTHTGDLTIHSNSIQYSL